MRIASASVADGLFELGDDGPHLIGSRCSSCGTLYFPQALLCRNPGCLDKTVERTKLASRGTLYSYTVQEYRPPPLFRMEPWMPYAIGLVELGHGLRVLGMLSGIPLDAIRIGMPLQLAVESLYRDDARGDVLTYKFVPDVMSTAAAS